MSRPNLKLNPNEQRLWEGVQALRVTDPSREGLFIRSFWNKAVTAYCDLDFVSSIVLVGITAELAHRTKLRKQNVEMYWKNGRPKLWGDLIERDEKDKEIQKIAREIKDKHRNVWVHPDVEKIERYLRSEGIVITTDVGLNIGLASAIALKVLGLTAQLLKMLKYTFERLPVK